MTDPNAQVSQVVGALFAQAVAVADDIIQGRVDPHLGAKVLWRMQTEVAGLEEDLRLFAGLASEWEDAPSQREEYERDITRAADRFRARHGP